jgi:hypothetical protein
MSLGSLTTAMCCGIWLLASLTAGCGSKPPPPASPPPAPPPPEVPVTVSPASDLQVGAWFRPAFFLLFDRGFRPATVDLPGRYPAAFGDGRIRPPAGQQFSPPLQKSIEDASATTPALQDLVSEQLGAGSAATAGTIIEWARKMSARSTEGAVYITSRDARRIILAMYFAQAIADADAQNFHRAHVLFSDVSRAVGADDDFGGVESFAEFRRFFTDVPDKPRYEAFAKRLENYIRSREESLLISGEHAAVLHVAGMKDAAEFMRDKLLSRCNLVLLPLIDMAILRGQGYGFSPPKQLAEMRSRLQGHAKALEQGRRRSDVEPYRAKAVKEKSSEEYLRNLEALELLVRGGTVRVNAAAGSVEKAVRSLQSGPRAIDDWVREKVLCVEHCPLYMLKPGEDAFAVEVGWPLIYESDRKSFVNMNLAAFAGGGDHLAATRVLRRWCVGEPLPEQLRNGSGHFIMAWYWLELNRPEFARMALLSGAEHLLGLAKAADLERMRANPVRDASAMTEALQAEVNGYRMLVAAAALASTPPGTPEGGGDSYLAELQVMMAAWRQSWLKCGLPEAVADDVVWRIEAESKKSGGVQVRPQSERYHFFDYRFRHGPVPDVVVERGVEKELFDDDGKVRGAEAGISEFMREFTLPVEFSKASRKRWGGG